jgi:MFS transporter, DHA1 family, multidrug resistance protein
MYTFVVYCASAIFVPSYQWIMIRYGVSQELASLGLAMYVAGCKCHLLLF